MTPPPEPRTATESAIQFLARMVICTREGHQVGSKDAQRLANLANYGHDSQITTMPEERRSPVSGFSSPITDPAQQLVRD